MLILGTAQIGLNYGATNTVGFLDEAQIELLIRSSIAAGILNFDTASAYGSSEERIGKFQELLAYKNCRIITKIAPLSSESERYKVREFLSDDIRKSIENSLKKLETETIDTVLVHQERQNQINFAKLKILREEK